MKIRPFAPNMTVFFLLVVAKALLEVEPNINMSPPKPLRTSGGHAFNQNGMFNNRPFKIEYR